MERCKGHSHGEDAQPREGKSFQVGAFWEATRKPIVSLWHIRVGLNSSFEAHPVFGVFSLLVWRASRRGASLVPQRCLVCSDVVARGIDIPEVHAVVNYSAPSHIQTYIHRVGRTARAGKARRMRILGRLVPKIFSFLSLG